MTKTYQYIEQHLNKAKNIIVVGHQNPDGDAVGALSAMANHLQTAQKKWCLFCLTPVPNRFLFIPFAEKITQDCSIFSNTEIDTIIVLDSGDLKYAGIANLVAKHRATIINIDHHPSNDNYGHINLVQPQAASTTQILYEFFKYIGKRINRDTATALLSGLINDTDSFFNPATSQQALTIAGELLRLGANLKLINKWMVNNKTINSLKIWGLILSRLEKREEQNITYTYLTKQDAEKYNINDAEAEGISNFLNKMDGVGVSLFLKENSEGNIKGSFRTTGDEVDVSLLAKKMGGGGHKKAAGFTANGTIENVLDRILTLGK